MSYEAVQATEKTAWRHVSGAGNRVRAIALTGVSAVVLTGAAVAMLVVGLLTGFQARRFYTEVMARWLGRAILRIWGIDVKLHRAEPFPTSQTIYVSNHPSTLDLFVLISLGLPNTRYFMSGWLRCIVPLGVIGYIIRIFFTPLQRFPRLRTRRFRNATRTLRRTGESAYLSPEGRRRPDGIGPFNKGVFHLTTELGAPIVPIYIDTPSDVSPGRGVDARPGEVHVYVKSPISTSHWRLEDLQQNKEAVRDLFLRWEAETRALRRSVYRSGDSAT
jgi:1-acyl-sn-glycerol-3-phosphate acyltransferase